MHINSCKHYYAKKVLAFGVHYVIQAARQCKKSRHKKFILIDCKCQIKCTENWCRSFLILFLSFETKRKVSLIAFDLKYWSNQNIFLGGCSLLVDLF